MIGFQIDQSRFKKSFKSRGVDRFRDRSDSCELRPRFSQIMYLLLLFGSILLLTTAVHPPLLARSSETQDQFQELLSEGKELLNQGKGETSIPLFKKAISLNPHSAEAHMLLGYAYRLVASVELIAEAKAELRQAIYLDPGLSWARFYLARIYLDLGQAEKAQDELKNALEKEPNNPFFFALYGEVVRQRKNPRLSVVYNQRAISLAPGLSLAHYYLGLAYTDLDRRADALKEYELATAVEPTLPEMHVSLGAVYLDEGRYEDSIVQLKKALTLDPLRAEGRLKLAKAYRLSGRIDLARAELRLLQENQRIQTQSPYFQDVCAEASFELGVIHRQEGKLDEALEDFNEVLRIKENHGATHRELAEIYFEQNEYSLSLAHAKQAIELGESVDESILSELKPPTEPQEK